MILFKILLLRQLTTTKLAVEVFSRKVVLSTLKILGPEFFTNFIFSFDF